RWGRNHCSAAFPDGDRRAGRRPLERLQISRLAIPRFWLESCSGESEETPVPNQGEVFQRRSAASCFIAFEQIETNRRRYTMTQEFRIAVAVICVLLGTGTQQSAFGSSAAQTYELELFVPQISQAANGELVSITGGGFFSIHP